MRTTQRGVFFSGLFLVAAGILLVVLEVVVGTEVFYWIPLLAGGALCAAAFVSRLPGFFIPGCLLFGLGAGIVVSIGALDVDQASVNRITGLLMIGVGAGLALVPFFGRIIGYSIVLWPFPPAILMLAFGLLLVIVKPDSPVGEFLGNVWPVAVALSIAHLVIVFLRRNRWS